MNVNEEQAMKMGQLIAKCWSDEAFKRKLLADPTATLKAQGLPVPEGVSVRAVENTDKLYHLVIPARPAELSDEDLSKVAAGSEYDGWADFPRYPIDLLADLNALK